MSSETANQIIAPWVNAKAIVLSDDKGRPVRTIVELGHRTPMGPFGSLGVVLLQHRDPSSVSRLVSTE
jgi:hypothetical protein